MATRIEQIIKNLKDYFDCKVVGSYLFIKDGYLTMEEINDVDVMVSDVPTLKKVIVFLKDNGFEETNYPHTTGEDRYGNFNFGSLIFKADSCELPIHLLLAKSDPPEVWSLPKILSKKWENRSKSDLTQLKLIVERTKAPRC